MVSLYRVLTLGLILSGMPARALDLSIKAWSSPCVDVDPARALDCGVPISISHAPILHVLPNSALEPGHSKLKTFPVQVIPSPDGDLRYELRAWEVYPKAGPRYYQVQFEWIAPARSMCMLSVDASKTRWSPMTCVSVDVANSTRYGLLIQTVSGG